ncbi:hypothetical protein N7463_002594 [Penicillium fimorum]|uniref:Uncharacterized protein n=1 Tax=Penicillium fimorum TaxID=1882269 RepID=A0A9W9XZG1_9EURO|nr:hypothetical protein N7463_002594 [Penicillium fimorum]
MLSHAHDHKGFDIELVAFPITILMANGVGGLTPHVVETENQSQCVSLDDIADIESRAGIRIQVNCLGEGGGLIKTAD